MPLKEVADKAPADVIVIAAAFSETENNLSDPADPLSKSILGVV